MSEELKIIKEIYDFIFPKLDLETISKIYRNGRMKDETKTKRIIGILFSSIDYSHLVEVMKSKIEQDAEKIKELVEKYIENPLTEREALSLNSFDYVTPFNYDPVENTSAHTHLSLTKGVYVFVMTKDYDVPKLFDDVYKGAPRRNKNITVFKKGDILYIGKANSFLTRMHKHFEKDDEHNTTGAIKLGSNNRKGLSDCIMIYAFQINKKYKKLYEMIGELTEKYLHNHLNYLLGNK